MENKKLSNLVLFEEFEEKEEVVKDEETTEPISEEEVDELDAKMDQIADEENVAGVMERIKRFGEK
jgi:hypothetical protein